MIDQLTQLLATLEVGAELTLQGQDPEAHIAFKALPNGSIKASFSDTAATEKARGGRLEMSPAPRYDIARLVTELMIFIPYESDSALITITNAAGVVTYSNGETGATIQTKDELPVRSGSIFTQVERYLEARFSEVGYCDCGAHQEWLSFKFRKLHINVTPDCGPDGSLIEIRCNGPWKSQVTDAVRREMTKLKRTKRYGFVDTGDGWDIWIKAPLPVFTAHGFDAILAELLMTRNELHHIYKQGRQQQ